MMELWHPFIDIDRTFANMTRWLTETANQGRTMTPVTTYRPPVNVYDAGEHFVFKALIPGASPESLDVTLEQNTLTLSGQYGYKPSEDELKNVTWYQRQIGWGNFSFSYTFPVPIDSEHVQATFENGILTLTLPKAEHARAKRISIKAPNALAGSLN